MSGLSIVIFGLSLSSSWGNGHATTYRALIGGLAARGHDVLFLERRQPWYEANRDLSDPKYCRLGFYDGLDDLAGFESELAAADAVVIGSYVPEAIALAETVRPRTGGLLAFYDIDTPVTLKAIADGTCAYLTRAQIPLYDLYFSFTGGPLLRRLEQDYGARRARALYCAVDPLLYRPKAGVPRYDLAYLGTYSADRQPGLEALLLKPARRNPALRCVVAGSLYPDDIGWPENVERIEHVPPAAHAAFYGASRFTLNLTRAAMKEAGFSPSVRLFESAACGTPIISDSWPGIGELLQPEREILLADDADRIAEILALPEERGRSIAAAARRKVLQNHTGTARAREMEAELLALRAERAAIALTPPAGSGASQPVAAPLEPNPASNVLVASTVRFEAMALKGKTALVAGGAGFLGSHLCERLLAEGAEVICLDNFLTGRRQNLDHLRRESRFDVIEADVIAPAPKALRGGRQRPHFIFNLACAASPTLYQADPEHTLLTSVMGTRNLLALAEQSGARFLLASTSEVYGDPLVHPQREDYFGNVNSTGPRACYDEGKRAAEALCFDYLRAERIDVRVARIFNTYGPRMRADDGRVVSNVITQALAGEAVTIYGNGAQTRSFCFVDDMIEALTRLMALGARVERPVNLGNPHEITVTELVRRVLDLTRSPSATVSRPAPVDDPRRRQPDIGFAQALLGWSPQVPLETGLKATIAWFSAEQPESAQVQPPLLQRAAVGARANLDA